MEELDHYDTGCITIYHGLQEKDCRRGQLGVMIVLSPLAKAAYVQWIHVTSWMTNYHIIMIYDSTVFDSTLHTYDGIE